MSTNIYVKASFKENCKCYLLTHLTSYLLVWDSMRHFQALKGTTLRSGIHGPSKTTFERCHQGLQNRVSPSQENMTVWASLMAHQFVNLPRFKIQQMDNPIATCWAKTRPDRERGGERKGERKSKFYFQAVTVYKQQNIQFCFNYNSDSC